MAKNLSAKISFSLLFETLRFRAQKNISASNAHTLVDTVANEMKSFPGKMAHMGWTHLRFFSSAFEG